MTKEIVAGLKPERLPDLVLVNSTLRDYGLKPKDDYDVLPPLGLAYIATQGQSKGHNIGLLDAEHHGIPVSEIAETVNAIKPRYVGINVLTPTRLQALNFAQKLDPEIPLIIGAAHASAMPKRTLLEFTKVHPLTILIQHEAELAIQFLLDGQPVKSIPGTFWHEKGEIKSCGGNLVPQNIDNLPILDRSYLVNDPSLNRFHHLVEARLLTSRGCPFNCSFCVASKESPLSLPVRFRSPQSVAQEVEGLVVDQNVQSIRFVDDLFLYNEKRVRSILRLISAAGFYWDANGRANIIARLKREFLDFLKDHGAHEIGIGIESRPPRLRERINKSVTDEDIEASINRLTQRGIFVKGYFMIGIPTETKEETQATLDYAKALTKDHAGLFYASIFIFRPYPGTKEWNYLLSEGYTEENLMSMQADGVGRRAKHEVTPQY